MSTINISIDAVSRRYGSKSIFNGTCLCINRLTTEDGEPERLVIEPKPNQEMMFYNQRGSILVRRADDNGWDIIPPGAIALVVSTTPVEAIISRGSSTSYWITWYRDCAGLLSRWMEEKRTQSRLPHAVAVTRSYTEENRPICHELIQALTGVNPMIEVRVLGAVQMLSVSTMLSSEEAALTQVTSSMSESLRHLVEEVRQDPVKDWSLQLASEVAGYSQFHLSRSFRAEMGYGFPEFVERCRVELAVSRVHHNHVDMNEIALDCGFVTPSAFREALKKIVGLLPSELRRFSHN